MAKKPVALVSTKGELYHLHGGPEHGAQLRLGYGLPRPKTEPPKPVPLPDTITYPQHPDGVYERRQSEGETTYQWTPTPPSTRRP